MNDITIEDIPKKLEEELRQAIRDTDQFVKLKQRHGKLLMAGRFVEATRLAKELKGIEDKALIEHLKCLAQRTVSMQKITAMMTEEDQNEFAALSNGIMFAADMIETFVSEMNQKVHKYASDVTMPINEELNAVSGKAHEMIRLLSRYDKNEYFVNNYGDTADKLYEMVYNKAVSFARKMRKHNESEMKKKSKKTA